MKLAGSVAHLLFSSISSATTPPLKLTLKTPQSHLTLLLGNKLVMLGRCNSTSHIMIQGWAQLTYVPLLTRKKNVLQRSVLVEMYCI